MDRFTQRHPAPTDTHTHVPPAMVSQPGHGWLSQPMSWFPESPAPAHPAAGAGEPRVGTHGWDTAGAATVQPHSTAHAEVCTRAPACSTPGGGGGRTGPARQPPVASGPGGGWGSRSPSSTPDLPPPGPYTFAGAGGTASLPAFRSHRAAQVNAAARGTPSPRGCTTPDAISFSRSTCPAPAPLEPQGEPELRAAPALPWGSATGLSPKASPSHPPAPQPWQRWQPGDRFGVPGGPRCGLAPARADADPALPSWAQPPSTVPSASSSQQGACPRETRPSAAASPHPRDWGATMCPPRYPPSEPREQDLAPQEPLGEALWGLGAGTGTPAAASTPGPHHTGGKWDQAPPQPHHRHAPTQPIVVQRGSPRLMLPGGPSPPRSPGGGWRKQRRVRSSGLV